MSTNAILLDQGLDLSHIFDLPKSSIVLSHWVIKNFRRGERIYYRNDKADRIYLIKEGKVKIGIIGQEDKVITKAVYGKNDFFGHLALLGETVREDFATAMTHCTIYSISLENMQLLMNRNKQVRDFFMGKIGQRLMRMERRVESLLFDTARDRVINYLKDLAQEKGIRVGYETLIRDFLPHQEIGNLTSTSRQTVSTILSELRRKNIIYVNRRQVLIRDMSKLV